MSEEFIVRGFGINIHAQEAWKKWVDEMHKVPSIDTTTVKEEFKQLWYPDMDENLNPIPNKQRLVWKGLVQRAFMDAYEAGFTDRIFKGDTK